MGDDQDGGWVSVSSGTGSPGQSRTKGSKMVVVVIVEKFIFVILRNKKFKKFPKM